MEQLIPILQVNEVDVVDSRIIADELGVQHKTLIETIGKHKDSIESNFGLITFETEKVNVGRPAQFCYLTEDQAIFLGTLSRNSEAVVKFKVTLVKSFQNARRVIASVKTELSRKDLALMIIQAEEEKERLVLENKILTPKAEYTDKVLKSETTLTATEIAKEFGMSASKLNDVLCERRIQYKHREHYVLTAKYQNKGYTKVTSHPYTTRNGEHRTRMQMEWTEYGRAFLHRIFNPSLSFSISAPKTLTARA